MIHWCFINAGMSIPVKSETLPINQVAMDLDCGVTLPETWFCAADEILIGDDVPSSFCEV